MSKELVKADEDLSVVKMNDFNNMGEALAYAEELIKCNLINFRKPEDAVMAFQMGKAVGLDPAIAATNFYVVNGRITYSVHLASALAKKAGVEWEIVKDAEGVFDENGNNVSPFMITQIKFMRYSEKIKRVVENVFTYTWDDASRAGYISKDNWTRMPKNMLRARCLIEGIRFVAPDVLAGVFYESSEMADNSRKNVNVVFDQDGNPVVEV